MKIVPISHSALLQSAIAVVLFGCDCSAVRQYGTVRRTKAAK